jgi:hypothetical protein
MERRGWLGWLAGFLVVLVLGFAGWRTIAHADDGRCYACNRPVHAHSRTVAFSDGQRRVFCCPACALSRQEQAGKPVTITELTSFLTGKALSPDSAYVVKGSDVNMCERTRGLVDADKRPADLHYDRCSPSLLAFAQRDEAVEFTREHGGEVMPFRQAAAALSK